MQESFPSNELEEALAVALQDASSTAEGEPAEEEAPLTRFVAALREGSLWVPLPEGSGIQDDGSVALPTLDLEGSPFIPVFTSAGQLSTNSAELPYTVVPARDLAGVLPEGVGLALNPGNEASVPIYPETVTALTQD